MAQISFILDTQNNHMKYKPNLIKKLLKTSHSNLFWSKKLLQKKILMPQII